MLSRIRQGDGWIGTQRNAGFFTANTVFEIPVAGATRLDPQIQTVRIGDFKGFIRRLEDADFCVGKGYMGVTPLSN
ncbi:hypothetical protein KYE034_16820 [Escherichia coli]|nr:hypothetical protein HMPREF9549_04565 [Escherichia coli MS 185-1]